jgi:enamidase
MTTTAIVNIGTLVSGNIQDPLLQADSILIENDKIAAVGPSSEQIKAADTVIDAAGTTLIPGSGANRYTAGLKLSAGQNAGLIT